MMSPTGPKPSVYLQFSSVTQACQTLCDPIDCIPHPLSLPLQCPFIDDYILALHRKIKNEAVVFPEE